MDILAGTYHDKLPDDILEALQEDSHMVEKRNLLTPLARNEWICRVTIVKKEETRIHHIQRLLEDIGKGKKRPCCWPGCSHHRPDAAKYFKTQKVENSNK